MSRSPLRCEAFNPEAPHYQCEREAGHDGQCFVEQGPGPFRQYRWDGPSAGDRPSHRARELVKHFGVEAGLYWRSSELKPDRVQQAESALLEYIAKLETAPTPPTPER